MREAEVVRLAKTVSDYLMKNNKGGLPDKVREAAMLLDEYLEQIHDLMIEAADDDRLFEAGLY